MVFIRRKRFPMRFRRRKVMRRRRITRGAKSARATTMKGRNIIMRRMFCKLPYESGNIGISSNYAAYQFRANSIWDPDYTGTGHQPRGHDEYAKFFRTYRVHGIKVEAWAQNLTSFTQSCISIYPHKSTAYPADVNSLLEIPDNKVKVFDNTRPVYIKKYISLETLFGKRKSVVNSDIDYSAVFGYNPATEGFVTIILGNMAGSTGEITHTLRVRLTYYCELTDPLLLSQS